MFNLFDILQAQSGQSLQALGQPFGLTPEQSRRAVEALLPALSIGLQRNAADPVGLGRLFGAFNPQGGAGSTGTQPDFLLGQLFGSQALSQAVLQQAAAASGIGTQALRQMLPLMAGMVVAGIVHMMLNQQPTVTAAQPRPEPEPSKPLPSATFWKDWMDNFLSAGDRPARAAVVEPATPRQTEPEQPRRRIADEAPSKPEPSNEKSETVSSEAIDVPMGVLNQMFETGAQVQEQNVKAMQELFDTFWTPRPSDEAPGPDPSAAPPAKKRAVKHTKPRQPRKKVAKSSDPSS